MRTLLFLIFGIALMLSLESCKKLPTESKSVTDSTVVTNAAVPVQVKGGKAIQKINVDSLQQLYSAGYIERYFTITDRDGLAELQQRIDLLTGRLSSKCTAKDTVYIVKYQTVEKFREAKTVQVQSEKLTTWQLFKKWVNTNLLLAFVICVVFLGLFLLRYSILPRS